MQFRKVGNTEIEVSVVGLGSEHVDNQPRSVVEEVVNAAIDNGITIMDMFMPGNEVRSNIGHALAGRRQKMVIQGAIGSVDLREQYDVSRELKICEKYFENMLRCLQTDYIDFGLLFFMDTHQDIDAVLDNGVVDYARKLKQQGKIRAIGASTHNPDTARRLVDEGLVEMLMFSINPAFDMMPGSGNIESMIGDAFTTQVTQADPKRSQLYRLCQQKGVGITVMKPLAAGKLLVAEHTPFAQAMTPWQCMHYALTRPAVASALVGCRSREEVETAVKYVELSDEERDYTLAISSFRDNGKGGFKGSCVYCNHCLPCPANIDIASVNKYLDIAMLDESAVLPSISGHYRSLNAHASDCVECGNCEKRCPFAVQVIARMHKATTLFGQ